MKIGVMPNIFPKLSKTFILDQITGMIDRGHNVEIYPSHSTDESIYHPAIDSYDINKRTTVIGPPNSLMAAISGSITNLAALSAHHPAAAYTTLRTIPNDGFRDAGEFTYHARSILGADLDILHAHFGPVGQQATRLHQAGASNAFVTSFHGWGIRADDEGEQRRYTTLFERCDRLLANSRHVASALLELGASPEKVQVHRVGINPDRFEPDNRSHDTETVTVLTVARLHEVKGLEYGIRGFERVIEQFPGIDLQYRIVGDGPQKKKLQDLIRSNGLGDHVTLCGPKSTDGVIEELHGADVFLLPSFHEGFGMVLLEAQASGLPVVASDVGGVREAVAAGKSAILVPKGEQGPITDELEYLIRNPSQRAKLGSAGRMYVRGSFDIDKLNDQLETLYNRLV